MPIALLFKLSARPPAGRYVPEKTRNEQSGGKAYDAQHVLPVQYEAQFRKAGVNIWETRYGAMIERRRHKSMHANGHNASWGRFFGRHPNPSQALIEKHASNLAKHYGFRWVR
jgi:hypothetical protein